MQVRFEGVTNVFLNVTDHTVTSGQPYGGVGNISKDTLDVRAGRKNSAPPAADFAAGIKIINVLGLKGTVLSSMPKELNFAVFGDLALVVGGREYHCENMRLGMGHARQDSAEDFSRLNVQRCTAMGWILIPAYCSANS